MSRTFKIAIETNAYAVMQVTLSDMELARIAVDFNTSVDKLTIEDLAEYIDESRNEPTICANCGGWGRDYSLELGDCWEVSLGSPDAPLHSAITEV